MSASRSYSYKITKTAKQDINRLSTVVRSRIGKKLEYFIEHDDPLQFAEKLTKHKAGDYRFRIGDYRVILIVEGKTIYIVRVQHRREVYRK